LGIPEKVAFTVDLPLALVGKVDKKRRLVFQ
jgi:hypothetical protein